MSNRKFVSWEQRAVDEIIADEETSERRSAERTGICPVCGHDLSEDCTEQGYELNECVKYCDHCGWESEPYYE